MARGSSRRQAQRTVSASQRSAGRPTGLDAEAARRCAFVCAWGRALPAAGLLRRRRVEVEDVLLLAAEERQDAVRRQLRQRLGEVEVVGELRALGSPCLEHLGATMAAAPTTSSRSSPMRSASSAKRSTRIARAPSSAAAASATPLSASMKPAAAAASGSSVGSAEQRVGQRLEPGLAGDLRLGAALRLVRQVDVLEPRLGVGGEDLARAARRRACPARSITRGSPRGAPRARAGSAAAPRACAAACRRGRR